MYRKLREELIHENITLLERCKAMGINIWPNSGGRTVEDMMIEIDKNSQEILKQKFGYGENCHKLNKEKDIKSYYFMTVNLEGEPNKLKDLYDKMQEAIYRYKWLRKSIINYEFYTEKGGHPHSHILMITDKRRDTIIYLLSRFFNIEKNYIDIKRYYGNPINHINYIKGIKKAESKQELLDKDTALRDELNIPPFTNLLESELEVTEGTQNG